jgi:hypothetical protein
MSKLDVLAGEPGAESEQGDPAEDDQGGEDGAGC